MIDHFVGFAHKRSSFKPLSANFTKWSYTLKQTIRRLLPTNFFSVFDHFVGLALKKDTLAQVFSSEFNEICQNTCFTELVRATVFVWSEVGL